MTSLEQYQHERRSGLYDTTEPKDADPTQPTKQAPPPMEIPKPTKSEPVSKDALRAVLVDLKGDINGLRSDIKKASNTALVLLFFFFLTAVACLAFLLKPEKATTKPLPVKQAVKIIKKKQVIVKKVQAKPKVDEWRKKKCYETGDWYACLAFKENLPARARVGRLDL